MAYDPVKAHEYYEQYRKKGLKKGRKKGTAKTTTTGKKGKKGTTTSLLGVSAAGLNDEGKIQAGLVREQYKKQMNTAMAQAKTEEEKQQIRLEYSRKAQQAMNELRGNAEYAKPKASSGGSKSSSGSGSSSSMPKISQAEIKRLKTQISKLNIALTAADGKKREKIKNVMRSILSSLKDMHGISGTQEKKYKDAIESDTRKKKYNQHV